MRALLLLPIAALVLPARFSLRLGAAVIVALIALGIYDSALYDPGAGYAPGEAILGAAVLLFFPAIVLGLILRGLWHLWQGNRIGRKDFAAPVADMVLAVWAMVVPAGAIALTLGDVLAGDANPLRTHLLLLAALAGLALLALFRTRGPIRAALIGFSLWPALIVADSMRFRHQIEAALPKDLPFCLAIGPDHQPVDKVPPLMGLTAPKPILLLTMTGDETDTRRWSFRWHGFVRDGTSRGAASCPPAP